jgi:hypothetical protein
VAVTASQSLRHESRSLRDTSAFAAPPRPLMESAANALRQASRKRQRESRSEQPDTEDENEASPTSSTQGQALSSDAFVALGRAGNTFSDHYMESLLKANLTELQGVGEQDAYSQRCWYVVMARVFSSLLSLPVLMCLLLTGRRCPCRGNRWPTGGLCLSTCS